MSADRGAIESIAETMHEMYGPFGIDIDAQRILDRLAADGYSVVETEWEYTPYGGGGPTQRRIVTPWEPVPEGSADA